MTALYVLLALVTTLSAGLLAAFYKGKKQGKTEQATEALEDVVEAKRIEDRYNSDAEYRERVRDRFKR